MKLTEEQQRLVVDFIERKWPNRGACPMCGQNDWAIRNRIFEIGEHSGVSRGAQRAVLPVVALTCENCANTVLLNAVKMGIVGLEPPRGGKETGSPQGTRSST